jgi:hypothetical protein
VVTFKRQSLYVLELEMMMMMMMMTTTTTTTKMF